MGRVEGKVVLITGAARGMGRAHALRLAAEGADIVVLDIASQRVETVLYPLATSEDLEETATAVRKLGRACVTAEADVRDVDALNRAVTAARTELGPIDVVVANHGIGARYDASSGITEDEWRDVLDVNLTGVWHVVKTIVPGMIANGRGGSIIIISSAAGLLGLPGMLAYVTSKTGLVGMMKSLANELAPESIRVNTIHPGNVLTPMLLNDYTFSKFRPDLETVTVADIEPVLADNHALPVPIMDPIEISNAVLWLASEESRCVTGVALPVDAGMVNKAGGRKR